MPTVTVPSPLSAIHSWVVVYFRRSGNSTASPWQGMTVVRSHAPSVRLPEKLAEQESLRVFLRRGRQGLLSRAPVPHAVLLPESLRGLTPSAPVDDRSLPRTAFGRGESTPVPRGAASAIPYLVRNTYYVLSTELGLLRLELQMKRLRPRERLEPEARERAAAPGVLDAGPGERRIEIVAAVHEPRARLHAIADAHRRLGIRGPDGSGEAIAAVVHPLDRLLVAGDGHDACHRPEDFLGHHALLEVDQDLRREIGRAFLVTGKRFRVDEGPGAFRHRLADLRTHRLRGFRADHRTERGLRIERIAEAIFARELDEAVYERLVERAVHINALDTAARLAGVEVRAVDQVFDRRP